MILYKNNTKGFIRDVEEDRVTDRVEASFERKLGRRVNPNERKSWINSINFIGKRVRRARLSDHCGILIEYVLPSSSKRIDFLICGEGAQKNKNLVIVELKQWATAESTEKRDLVQTWLGGGFTETPHPSYQARSYRLYLQDFVEGVDTGEGNIRPHSCAYLHNYSERHPEPLKNQKYQKLVQDTPLYFKDDHQKLEQFLHRHLYRGRGEPILYEIEAGRIRPSKRLIDHVTSMFQGNEEFVLLDEQKVAYETAFNIAKEAQSQSTCIITGGPGTGKSVISVNLLGGLLREELNVAFVAPNASFREAMIHKLAQNHPKTRLRNIFSGSSSFVDAQENIYDALIVDEAHRLKNNMAFMYQGENQIEDILKAAEVVIFFVDDAQRIRPEDIGSVDAIKQASAKFDAHIHQVELNAQFRCAGAEGYVNWLDNTLQIRDTANYDGWDQKDFEFRIFKDPKRMYRKIRQKDAAGQRARMLAGYAWDWTSKKQGNPDAEVEDIQIPKHGFSMPWNSRKLGNTWAIEDEGLEQVGCVHTAQGLEFDYVGVIIGNDLRFDTETMTYYTEWDAYKDRNGKQTLQENPKELNKLVRNIYKILMSRGMKGCYVYFMDSAVEACFRERLKVATEELEPMPEPVLYENALPLLDLRTAADAGYESLSGYFGYEENFETMPVEGGPFREKQFLVRAEGNSMEPRISNGDLCLFNPYRGGSRNGKIVLVRFREFAGDAPVALIKKYESYRRAPEEGSSLGRAERIILSSLNHDHDDILLQETGDVEIIGVFEDTVTPLF